MRFLIAFLFVLAVSILCIGFTNAQLVTNNGGLITVQNNADITIQGDIQIKNNGVFPPNIGTLENFGQVQLDGKFELSTAALTNIYDGSRLEVGGDWISQGIFTATTNSEVEFNGDAKQNYNCIGCVFGHATINTPELELLPGGTENNFKIQPGSNLTFGTSGKSNVIKTNEHHVIMATLNSEVSKFVNINTGAGGASPEYANYVIGNIFWITENDVKSTYEFPVGGPNSLQYLELNFNTPATVSDANILGLRVDYKSGIAPAPNPDNDCGVMGIVAYTGVWNYFAYDSSIPTLGNEVTQLSAGDLYQVSVSPRGVSPGGSNYSIEIKHTNEGPDFKVHKESDGNCFNTTNPFSLQANDLNKFSSVGGVLNDDPFPLDFLDFTATPGNDVINLKWVTTNEVYVNHFEVERSTDGSNFSVISNQIDAKSKQGNQASYTYRFTDRKVVPNQLYYYRIKQNDVDGRYSRSVIRKAKIEDPYLEQSPQISIYPNPSDGLSCELSIQSYYDEDLIVHFYDVLGRNIQTVDLVLNKGFNIIDLKSYVAKLSKGTYQIKLQSEHIDASNKIVFY